MPPERDRWSSAFCLLSKNILMSRKRGKKEEKNSSSFNTKAHWQTARVVRGQAARNLCGYTWRVTDYVCCLAHSISATKELDEGENCFSIRFRAKGRTNKRDQDISCINLLENLSRSKHFGANSSGNFVEFR